MLTCDNCGEEFGKCTKEGRCPYCGFRVGLSVKIKIDIENESVPLGDLDMEGIRSHAQIGDSKISEFTPLGLSAGGTFDPDETRVISVTLRYIKEGWDFMGVYEQLSNEYSMEEVEEIFGRILHKLGWDK